MSSVEVSLPEWVFCGGGGGVSVLCRLSGGSRLTGASFLVIGVWACLTLGHNTSRGFHAVNTYSFIPGYAGHG